MYFDARQAKLLRPGEHLVVEGAPGLRLIASTAKRVWVYRYEDTTKRMKQISFGQWPAMPFSIALAEWQKLRDIRSSGGDPGEAVRAERKPSKPEAKPTDYTVGKMVSDFVAGHLKVARQPDGAANAERMLNRLLEDSPVLAGKPVAQVTRADAFEALERWKDTPTIAGKLRSLMGGATDLALDAGRVSGDVPNWWRSVQKGKLKSKGKRMGGKHVGRTRRVLSATEVGLLVGWLPRSKLSELHKDAIHLYLATGARGSEILSMRPEHVKQEASVLWWTIPKALTKNRNIPDAVDLRVPLLGKALEIVKRRFDAVGKSGWLFADDGKKAKQANLSAAVYREQPYSRHVRDRQSERDDDMPVTHWSPHNLRRTGRTLLASLGCPNEIGEAIIGHLPPEMVATYNAYSYDAERVEWLTKLSEHLESLASPTGSK